MLDTQSQVPTHKIEIDRVGITDFLMPIKIKTIDSNQNTNAIVDFSGYLGNNQRGIHMSRFVIILHEFRDCVFDYNVLEKISKEAKKRLKIACSFLSLEFDYFITKKSPVTKFSNLVNYKVLLGVNNNHRARVFMRVAVPVVSLCPCSRDISESGAHNQRGIVTICADLTRKRSVWIDDLIKLSEAAASSELYSILKREDEKYVTEHAYQKPAFIEDIVRQIDDNLHSFGVENYEISCKNFESIHNHNVFALIRKGEICY